MTEQWQELKETIIELRDNDGTNTQQEVCKFLANYMDVLEKQMRDATPEERESVDKYIKSISKPTGVDFWDLEQEPCDDWYDVPSDEMTLKQARKAVKDLRKKLMGYLDQESNGDAVSRDVFEQVRWERDVAIEQLKELGYALGQKIEPCEDAISRQAVINSIANTNFGLSSDNWNEIMKAINAIPSINPQKWIPVSERLPETDGEYFVIQKSGRVGIYVFNSKGNSEEYWKRCAIAWMPLSQPYKAESEEV